MVSMRAEDSITMDCLGQKTNLVLGEQTSQDERLLGTRRQLLGCTHIPMVEAHTLRRRLPSPTLLLCPLLLAFQALLRSERPTEASL